MFLRHDDCNVFTKVILDGFREEEGLIFRRANGLEELASSSTETVEANRELVHTGSLIMGPS